MQDETSPDVPDALASASSDVPAARTSDSSDAAAACDLAPSDVPPARESASPDVTMAWFDAPRTAAPAEPDTVDSARQFVAVGMPNADVDAPATSAAVLGDLAVTCGGTASAAAERTTSVGLGSDACTTVDILACTHGYGQQLWI
jgi:hypothetical protein